MRSSQCLATTVTQWSEPSWGPLLRTVGEGLAVHFMWMHVEEAADGSVIQAYKHRWTRRYLYVGDDGVGYVPTRCDRLAEIRLDWALERVLLPRLLDEDLESEEREAIREAIRRATDGRPEVTW